jgi:hypothetical protein
MERRGREKKRRVELTFVDGREGGDVHCRASEMSHSRVSSE